MITVRSRGRPKYSAASAVMCDSRDEEALAPAGHPGSVAGPQLDRREEVGGFVDLERALQARLRGQAQRRRDVGLLHVAEAGADVGDAVVAVAEVVDREALGGRHVGDRERLDREDDDVLVEDLVVLDVGAHRQRRRRLVAVEEDRRAGGPLQRRAPLVQRVDELAQRALLALAPRGDQLAPALPGRQHGEHGHARSAAAARRRARSWSGSRRGRAGRRRGTPPPRRRPARAASPTGGGRCRRRAAS